MTYFDRRDFLRGSAASLGAVFACTLGTRQVRAANGGRKLLNIFLRGGNDGLNTVIPLHDVDYSATLRPTLHIPSAATLDLGNGGAAFHPAFGHALGLHQAGELATIHRVGYDGPTLSHFSSQRFWETAKPGDEDFDEGFVARWAGHKHAETRIPAVSVSAEPQRMFLGERVLPHVPLLANYQFGDDAISRKLLGQGGSSAASGLIATFEATSTDAEYNALVRQTGRRMAASIVDLEAIQPLELPAHLFPTTLEGLADAGLPAQWWAASFFQAVRDAVRILVGSECEIAGVELSDFDHHIEQGGLAGVHPEFLQVVSYAMNSVREATLGQIWNDLVVVVESEFGRTSAENGSHGTDHGGASVMFVAGGRVLGNVYNCDPITWPSGDTVFSKEDKYVDHLTDFRTVLAEIFQQHLGAETSDLDVLIPGWSGLSGPTFDRLGFLA